MPKIDVVVVGGGNAGFTAAHAAGMRGRSVTVLERGEYSMSGGNSYYTAGATRIAHHGLDDLTDVIEPDKRISRTVVPPYTEADYRADLERVTEGNGDRGMAAVLAAEAAAGVRWLHDLGLRYRLLYERQAYQSPDGTYKFWGGLHIGNVGGGQGLIAGHEAVAQRLGTDVRYDAHATGLLVEGDRVVGVTYRDSQGQHDLYAESVVLASGGFEANPRMRRQYLGAGWERAKLRGTPYDDGEMLLAALQQAGAARGGDWSTCHSVQWDAFAADNESNRELTNRLTRQSYNLGIIVNSAGERFVDEGADFRNYTYAKYGAAVLMQPGGLAYQIFDATLRPQLRAEEYDMPGVSYVQADSVITLARRMKVDARRLSRTIAAYNTSIDTATTLDTTVRDGRAAHVVPPKSNWATPLQTPPFYGYPVTCAITFTFGGLKGDLDGRVLDTTGNPIGGLFACGEALGGLFSSNYPGGSGLAAGIVFGRRAGQAA